MCLAGQNEAEPSPHIGEDGSTVYIFSGGLVRRMAREGASPLAEPTPESVLVECVL